MISGREKVTLLLSLLGDKSKDVLSRLSPESARVLTSAVGDTPEVDSDTMNALFTEVIDKVDAFIKEDGDISEKKDEVEELDSDKEEEEGGQADNDVSLEKDTSSETSLGEGFRSFSEIASLLGQQKSQLIAFFLSKLEEDMSEQIKSYFSSELRADVESRSIQNLPVSDMVFDELFNQICKKPIEEES